MIRRIVAIELDETTASEQLPASAFTTSTIPGTNSGA